MHAVAKREGIVSTFYFCYLFCIILKETMCCKKKKRTLYAFWPNREHEKAKEKNKAREIDGEIGVPKSNTLQSLTDLKKHTIVLHALAVGNQNMLVSFF